MRYRTNHGGLAQLGERLICIQEVSGSIPLFSTKKITGKATKTAFPVTFYAILKMENGAERSKTECYCIRCCTHIVTVSSFRLPLRVKICGA